MIKSISDYQPQRLRAPDGTDLIVLAASDYEQLLDDLDDARDALAADASIARTTAGEPTMPGEVVFAMIEDGLTAVAAWRRFRGWTQADLAARADLSQVFVSKIESGAAHGSPATRRKLAKAFDAPLWALDDWGAAG